MLVLVAVLFVAGPTLDPLICAADDLPAPAAAAQVQATVQALPAADAALHHTAGEAPGTCPHGHVHAALTFAELDAPVAAPLSRPSAILRPISSRLPPSIAGPGLDRPPRA